MITLKGLKLKGFRAYTESKEFIFDNPVILLFGENHRGKSSTLNAIEWCLFGSECMGAQTGIRERIDWEIPNRNLHPPHASVELELEDKVTADKLTISRRWVSARRDELKVTLPDGHLLRGHEAKEKLTQLLKSSFRDFLATVYQHQEAIRAVLTQEPRERNDAIDRLLGLSDYRNILTGMEAARLPTEQKKMGENFDRFTGEIEVALRTRESDLKSKRAAAGQKGLREDQLNEAGALKIGREVKRQLNQFASEVGLSLVDLPVPEQWKKLPQFQEVAQGEIKRFRSEMPDVKKQRDLFGCRSKITELTQKYEQKRQYWDSTGAKFEDFVKQKGDHESIDNKIKEMQNRLVVQEKKLRGANAKAALVRDAIEYLTSGIRISESRCPVCGSVAPDLLEHLKEEWEQEIKNQVGAIQKQIKNLKVQLKQFEGWGEDYCKLKENFEKANKEMEEIKKQIGKLLDREITDKDDPQVLLNNESGRIEKELKKLERAVKSKHETLDKVSILLEQTLLIADILNMEEKKKVVEQIQQSHEYQRMEELRDRMAILVNDVDKIKRVIGEVSHEEAQQKVSTAGEVIDDYFRRIVHNPSVSKIEFWVSADS
ncbi:MAG: AAA family ATPase, partial [Candidatus Hydrothermarchaeota archaeon]